MPSYQNKYSKMTRDEIMSNFGKDGKRVVEFEIGGNTSLICCEDGTVFRKMKSGNWKKVENKENHKKGYNVILVNKKQYMRAKIVLYALNKISLDDKHVNICHLNKDKLDCSFSNLQIKGAYELKTEKAL